MKLLLLLIPLVGCGVDCTDTWDWSSHGGFKRTDQIGYCLLQEASAKYDEETDLMKSEDRIKDGCYDARKALTRLEEENRYLVGMKGGDELFHREQSAKERIKQECKRTDTWAD